jgi:hypothetical protein
MGKDKEDKKDQEAKTYKFLWLDQSQGGIFKLPFCNSSGVQTNCIGTYNCWNCVCVYIPIDEKTCFTAHIDAWTCPAPPNRDGRDMIPPKGSEDSLKHAVKEMLKKEISAHLPSGKLDDNMSERAIILNMRPTLAFYGVSTRTTGYYIAEAIAVFFDLKGNSEDQLALGFAVNHATAEAEYFRWKGNGNAPTARCYDRMDEYRKRHGEESDEAISERTNRQYPDEKRKVHSARSKNWRFGCHEGIWYPNRVMLAKGWWVD